LRDVRRSAVDVALEPADAYRALNLGEPLTSLSALAGSPPANLREVHRLGMMLCNADGGTKGRVIAPMDEVSEAITYGDRSRSTTFK
jgi:hypothetical protein